MIIFLLILLLIFNSYQLNTHTTINDYNHNNKEVIIDVDEPDKPAMSQAILVFDGGDYYAKNTYNVDYLLRDTVGMVGVPI